MTPLDAAITWIQQGYSPVPVPHRSKRPALKEWQRLEITTEGASQYFNGAAQNIGVLLGDKFGSADVDWSCSSYKPGPTRKVPGRNGMTYEEEDWVDQDATAHRGPDE